MTAPAEATAVRHEIVVNVPIERAFSSSPRTSAASSPESTTFLASTSLKPFLSHALAGTFTTAASTAANVTGPEYSHTNRLSAW